MYIYLYSCQWASIYTQVWSALLSSPRPGANSPHVVTENAAFALLEQRPHPEHALTLVRVDVVVEILVEVEPIADVHHVVTSFVSVAVVVALV